MNPFNKPFMELTFIDSLAILGVVFGGLVALCLIIFTIFKLIDVIGERRYRKKCKKSKK